MTPRDWTRPTPGDAPGDLRLNHFLEHRAALSPNHVAWEDDAHHLTYRRLDQLANGLGHALLERGLTAEEPVAVAMERGLTLPVAFQAVLKAGGALLYLDPSEAPERCAALLATARPRLILGDEASMAALPSSLPRLALDGILTHGRPETLAPDVKGDGSGLAQLLPTSGSTGAPKLVMRTHGMLAGQLLYEQRAFALQASDRHLFKFPVSFRETLLAALAGGSVVVADPKRHRDPGYLVRLIADRGVTVASFVPSLLKQLLAEPEIAGCRTLRHVSAGGERMVPEIERRFHAVLAARLHITYTMTEADYVSTWSSEPGHEHPAGWLGRPTNMRLWVVDEDLQPTPPGEIGEVLVAGPALARGYLNDPDLTAARFVPEPGAEEPTARAYRTGDLAQVLADGRLVHAGRADDQVKIGGLRIDLGEVDAALLAAPGVRDAAVGAWRSPSGDLHLIGHVVPHDGAKLDGELRAALRQRLPQHMTPTHVVEAAALPKLSNGKLDRRALPPPPRRRPPSSVAYAEPVTDTEALVAEVWAETLWIEPPGRDDSFVELGGNSALALAARGRLMTRLGRSLSLADLYVHPTVAALAAALDAIGPGATPHPSPARRGAWGRASAEEG
jgi:amino acid adenylation domain-containing protein